MQVHPNGTIRTSGRSRPLPRPYVQYEYSDGSTAQVMIQQLPAITQIIAPDGPILPQESPHPHLERIPPLQPLGQRYFEDAGLRMAVRL